MHKAQALAIHCIDLRFQKMVDEDLEKRGLEDKFDRVSWPGASLDFENIKSACDISLRLHDPDEVIIYEHEDCGAYGADNATEKHKNNAEKLKSYLIDKKPAIKVTTLIATFDGIKNL